MCPYCALYDQTAVAAALLEDLSETVTATGEIPPGLGGTIHQARERLMIADQLLHGVGLAGSPADTCIEQTIAALTGWLTPGGVTVVAGMARSCRRSAYQVARNYFAPSVTV